MPYKNIFKEHSKLSDEKLEKFKNTYNILTITLRQHDMTMNLCDSVLFFFFIQLN